MFVHATDKPAQKVMWGEGERIGEYVINYDDGTACGVDILYGANIYRYDMAYAQPIESLLFRHEGYAATYLSKPVCGKLNSGGDYTLYAFRVKNPKPDKMIKSITLMHEGNTDADIMLFEAALLN